jgi:hypothetical protein
MNGNFTVAPMEFKGVTFSYDSTPAVEDISLTLKKVSLLP